MTILYLKGEAPFRVPDTLTYDPDEEKYYYAAYRPNTWLASTEYVKADVLVLPPTPNGFLYECSSSGISAATAPIWKTVEGELTTDNTVVWKAKAYNLMLRTGDTIVGSSWAGTNGETIDNDVYINGSMTQFRLTAVPPGSTEVVITNYIDILRANGATEKRNRSIIIPILEL